MSSKVSCVYHHAIRWSAEHNDATVKKMQDFCKLHADKWIFQAECTENNGKRNPHYQGYMHTKLKIRSKQLAKESNDICRGIEIQPASSAGLAALRSYCMKEETRVAGPWANRRLYRGQDLWGEEKMLPWQRQLLAILRAPPKNRKIYWIFDPVGENGKTMFSKYLTYKEDALVMGYGHAGDNYNLVSKFQNLPVYVFDLTRTRPKSLDDSELYSCMEGIKNGMFNNLKYETARVVMCIPHVVIFSNHLPRIDTMSRDRWVIYCLHDQKMVPYVPTKDVGEFLPAPNVPDAY